MLDVVMKKEPVMSPIMKDVYRRLRTNIEFTGIENKVICITSCVKNDGKSSVSYNLARILADNDKKVLLIDGDMRNSVLPEKVGISRNLKGLSHFLAGKENMMDTIYSTNHKHLFLMPTGVLPKNPTELLNKPRLSQLIEASRQAFDYVIIDTPPLGPVIDAAVIAKEADGSILVLSSGKISRKVARGVKNQLEQANSNILGVVLNKVDTRSRGYGYGYGYGYGATEKSKK